MTYDPAVASRYAQALVALAHRHASGSAVLEDLAAIHQIMERHESLGKFLANPEISIPEKQQLLTQLFQEKVTPLALRSALFLLWKGRLPLLPAILTEAERKNDEAEGVVRGQVRTSRALAPELIAALRLALARRVGKRVFLACRVDPTLIGGISVQIGSVVLDGSLRNALATLRNKLLAAPMA